MQNFNGVATGGRCRRAGCRPTSSGTTTVAWTTRNVGARPGARGHQQCATTHINNGLGTDPITAGTDGEARSSSFPNAQYATVDFDIAFDTEDDPGFATTVRGVGGPVQRRNTRTDEPAPVLAEAFAERFKTGTADFYPEALSAQRQPRVPTGSLWISAWAGDSRAGTADVGSYTRVRLKLPGMAGSTVRLLFDYAGQHQHVRSPTP